MRIGHLDGLRAVAILSVLLFHYFARWLPPASEVALYPYGDVLRDVPLVKYGYYGVHLFFIISGFVITMTLTRCGSWHEFAVRRFARLFPAMLVCSASTYLVLVAIPGAPFVATPYYFVPSLTFIDPLFFNKLAGRDLFRGMDGAYWSLFVEMKFYVLMATLYFFGKARVVRNFLFLCGGSFLIGWWLQRHAPALGGRWMAVTSAEYFPWFLMGVGFYFEHARCPTAWSRLAIGTGAALVIAYAAGSDATGVAAGLILPAFFYAAMRLGPLQRLLSNRLLSEVGKSSYSLYLIHQYAGIAVIIWLARRVPAGYALAVPFVVAAMLIAFSLWLYNRYEIPAGHLLLKVGGRRPATAVASRSRPAP